MVSRLLTSLHLHVINVRNISCPGSVCSNLIREAFCGSNFFCYFLRMRALHHQNREGSCDAQRRGDVWEWRRWCRHHPKSDVRWAGVRDVDNVLGIGHFGLHGRLPSATRRCDGGVAIGDCGMPHTWSFSRRRGPGTRDVRGSRGAGCDLRGSEQGSAHFSTSRCPPTAARDTCSSPTCSHALAPSATPSDARTERRRDSSLRQTSNRPPILHFWRDGAQRLPLVHFSAQPEPFLSLKPSNVAY